MLFVFLGHIRGSIKYKLNKSQIKKKDAKKNKIKQSKTKDVIKYMKKIDNQND